ncbi:hypothetical protein BASA81_006657 [Batrachochytrium salamandrivorans]|nr:hypothetical protein BASA81_006657 [Batrachochytrium salamandrivorans]
MWSTHAQTTKAKGMPRVSSTEEALGGKQCASVTRAIEVYEQAKLAKLGNSPRLSPAKGLSTVDEREQKEEN